MSWTHPGEPRVPPSRRGRYGGRATCHVGSQVVNGTVGVVGGHRGRPGVGRVSGCLIRTPRTCEGRAEGGRSDRRKDPSTFDPTCRNGGMDTVSLVLPELDLQTQVLRLDYQRVRGPLSVTRIIGSDSLSLHTPLPFVEVVYVFMVRDRDVSCVPLHLTPGTFGT